MANRRARTVVTEIGLLGAATRIGERYALDGALSFIYLSTTVVAYKHGLSSHEITSTIADDSRSVLPMGGRQRDGIRAILSGR
jgi:hypothetical protein